MTGDWSAPLIEPGERLARRRCLMCGRLPALDWPYICDGCVKRKVWGVMPDPIMDVQETLDNWLAGNAEAQKYIKKIFYVPEGDAVPPAVTQMVRVTSIHHPDLELRLGVVATTETAVITNVLMGLIGRLEDADPKG